jgi:hypothetical protein
MPETNGFGFGKVSAEWRAVGSRAPDIRRHRVDHPRPGSGRARRRVVSVVVPQGDDALDTQEWDSEQSGQEVDLISMVAVGQSPSLMSLYPSPRDEDEEVLVPFSA